MRTCRGLDRAETANGFTDRTSRNRELRSSLESVIVMLANTTGIRTGYMAGRFPGLVGHLYSPGAQRGPFEFIPYGLDNERFTAGSSWSESKWIALLDWARLSGRPPLWVLVPDVVGDRERTLADYNRYYPLVRSYGWPVAFAVQDGMTASDVPPTADVVFVGGTTDWKWATMAMWCASFPRVHIGRVNTYRRLWDCADAGAESTDGTGWMRGDQIQYRGLMAFFEERSGSRQRQLQEALF